MNGAFHFRCSECGREHEAAAGLMVCPQCKALQQPGGETRGVLEVVLHELPDHYPDPGREQGFIRALLPVGKSTRFAPLSVGNTPLLEAPRLRHELEMPRLWIKDDSRNPSGSTKDRASLLVAAKAQDFGLTTIATASTGNAATALAAICAADGLEAVVFVPAAAPPAKLVQILSYGARLIPVQGSYDDAFELCQKACTTYGWYNRNTALNPYTIEGKKTAAVEIAAQLSPQQPDVVVVPSGDGVILAGVAKGFADLIEAGLIHNRPRLIAVQPEGSAALVNAMDDHEQTVTAVLDAASVADSLTVQTPRNARLCLKRIRESGGGGVKVTDGAIVEAINRLARLTGVFAEPAAAAALAGLEMALERGLVDRNERTVLLITGTGLKDIPAASRTVTMPEAIAPNLDAVQELFATSR